ncbi:TIGR03747 family integrating conjugative element membrane protein [Pseudorhodoferax sp. LjRoot39]|uniref:TIGR03747 family integrating conjugative element membrane protein n=1 Tax=Pseudorhodoferax sp. LjRoot39 TaxID=3342328 RepID=UPI003ECEA1FA
MNAPANRGPVKPPTRGPVLLMFEICMGLVMVALFSWFVGIAIEVIGMHMIWKDEGEAHAKRIVDQDVAYIAAAPRSLLIDDTAAFSRKIVLEVEAVYRRVGILRWYLRYHGPDVREAVDRGTGGNPGNVMARGLRNATVQVSRTGSRIALISMFVAQDVLLRMSIAIFAMPAFVLACLLGAIDGLVRRDLRRWGGGRESSFIYHHAKRYTHWALTGGFGLYLTWPFGGFNPAYMVLVFTVLVAASLSTTVAAFKKYV